MTSMLRERDTVVLRMHVHAMLSLYANVEGEGHGRAKNACTCYAESIRQLGLTPYT